MEVNKSKNIGEYNIKGLKILTYEDKNFDSYYVTYNVRYGGNDYVYLNNNNEVSTPSGIAHFLEHVMFNTEDGDAFTKFGKNGASANAYTTNTRTAYLFSCKDKVLDNLKILLGMVSNLYIDESKISKERDIINEEIEMYAKDIDYRQYSEALKTALQKSKYKDDILGTRKTIKNINTDNLKQVFRDNYQRNNSYLVIVGCDTDKIIRDLKKNIQEEKINNKNICITKVKNEEVNYVGKERTIEDLQVANDYNIFSYKIPFKLIDNSKQKYYLKLYFQFFLETYFSKINKEYNQLEIKGIIDYSFDYDLVVGDNFSLINFYYLGDINKFQKIINLKKLKMKLNEFSTNKEEIIILANKKRGELIRKFLDPKLLGEILANLEENHIDFSTFLENLKTENILKIFKIKEIIEIDNSSQFITKINKKML